MKFNTLQLKLIAMLFMLIDHTAWLFIPETTALYAVLRIIGRLAAPLFWYCFVVGFKKTRNKKKYVGRLGVMTGVMGVGNIIINHRLDATLNDAVSFTQPNIFLTMFLMALILLCIEKMRDEKTEVGKALLTVSTIVLSMIEWCFAEYSLIAWASILCFYYHKYPGWKRISFIVINVILCLIFKDYMQIAMILAVWFIKRFDSEKPRNSLKLLFYLFYPAHIWLLLLLSAVVG